MPDKLGKRRETDTPPKQPGESSSGMTKYQHRARANLFTSKPQAGLSKEAFSDTPKESKSILKKPEVKKMKKDTKVTFDDGTQEGNTHSSRRYDRKPSTENNTISVVEDRIDDLGYGSVELDITTIVEDRIDTLEYVYSNSKAIYDALELKLGIDELKERTGIKDIDGLMNSANETVDLMNANETINYQHLNTLLDIVDKAKVMEEKLEKLWQEVRPPKRAAALSAEETTKQMYKQPRRSQ